MSVFDLDSGSRRGRRSPIYYPAVAFVPEGGKKWRKFTTNDNYDKIRLDTGSSTSYYQPPEKNSGHFFESRVSLGGGGDLVDVSALPDYSLPRRSGTLGEGPFSRVMDKVEKLELTKRRGRYTKLRSGSDVDDSGYRFADTVRIDAYPEAWTVRGFIEHNSTEIRGFMAVNIVLHTLTVPGSRMNPTAHKVEIGESSFSLRRDQFFFGHEDAMLVNPIVLGYPL